MKRVILSVAVAALAVTSADAARVYVTSNQVKIIDDVAGDVVGTIDLGKSYVRDMVFSADGSTAYVAHTRGVAVVDVATSAVTANWSDWTVSDLALDDAGGTLSTLEHKAGSGYRVVTYDVSTGDTVRSYAVDNKALDLTAPPAGGRVFTTNLHRGVVTSYDRLTGEAGSTLDVAPSATPDELGTYIIKSLISPDGGTIYVVLNGERAGITTISATTGETTGQILLGHPAYVRDAVLSPDGTRMYISALDHLSVVDLGTGTELAWVDLEVTHQGIAVSPDGSRVYLVNPVYDTSGSLAVVDARTFELVKRISVPDISPYRVAIVP